MSTFRRPQTVTTMTRHGALDLKQVPITLAGARAVRGQVTAATVSTKFYINGDLGYFQSNNALRLHWRPDPASAYITTIVFVASGAYTGAELAAAINARLTGFVNATGDVVAAVTWRDRRFYISNNANETTYPTSTLSVNVAFYTQTNATAYALPLVLGLSPENARLYYTAGPYYPTDASALSLAFTSAGGTSLGVPPLTQLLEASTVQLAVTQMDGDTAVGVLAPANDGVSVAGEFPTAMRLSGIGEEYSLTSADTIEIKLFTDRYEDGQPDRLAEPTRVLGVSQLLRNGVGLLVTLLLTYEQR